MLMSTLSESLGVWDPTVPVDAEKGQVQIPSAGSVHTDAVSHSGVRLRTQAPLYPDPIFELVPALPADTFILGRNDLHEEDMLTIRTSPNRFESPSEAGDDGRYIHINSRVVSKRHARIHFDEDQVLLTDLGSTHGTWVLRERSPDRFLAPGIPFPLEDGDEIRIGRRILSYPAVHLAVEFVEPVRSRIGAESSASVADEIVPAIDATTSTVYSSNHIRRRRTNTNCYRAPDSDMDISAPSSPSLTDIHDLDAPDFEVCHIQMVSDQVASEDPVLGLSSSLSAGSPVSVLPDEGTEDFLSFVSPYPRAPVAQSLSDSGSIAIEDLVPSPSAFHLGGTPSALLAGFTPENMRGSQVEDMAFSVLPQGGSEGSGPLSPDLSACMFEDQSAEGSPIEESAVSMERRSSPGLSQVHGSFDNVGLSEERSAQELDSSATPRPTDVIEQPMEERFEASFAATSYAHTPAETSALPADARESIGRPPALADSNDIPVGDKHLQTIHISATVPSDGAVRKATDGSSNLQDITATLEDRLVQLETKLAALRGSSVQPCAGEQAVAAAQSDEQKITPTWVEVTSFMDAIRTDAHVVHEATRLMEYVGQPGIEPTPRQSSPPEETTPRVLGKRKRDDVKCTSDEPRLSEYPGAHILLKTEDSVSDIGEAGDSLDDSGVHEEDVESERYTPPVPKRRCTRSTLAFLAGGLATWVALGCDLGL